MSSDGGRGREWQFEATAETAGWVTPFFQARDRFVTTADATLLPIEHSREIREGRRRLDRTYLFDRAARHVRVGRDARGGTRRRRADASARTARRARRAHALYYLRSLPVPALSSVTVPINDAGTALVLQAGAVVHETIDYQGRAHRRPPPRAAPDAPPRTPPPDRP